METRRILELCYAFAQEAGQEVLFAEQNDENPYDMVFLPAFLSAGEGYEDVMPLCVYFAPSKYAFMDEMQFDLMQMMCYIPNAARPNTLRELRSLLGEINFQLPVGSFDVDADGTLFLRYTLPVMRDAEPEAFLKQYGVANALLGTFGLTFLKPIYSVIRGERTAKGAMEDAQQELDAIYEALQANLKGEN